MYLQILRVVFTSLSIVLFAATSSGIELKTKYTTVIFHDEDYLRKFNKEFRFGSLSYLLKGKKSITIEDEVKNKIDAVVERVEDILSMYPKKKLAFIIMLLPDDKDVRAAAKKIYGFDVDLIAFYSRTDNIVYLSVRDIHLGVLAHEFAHVIIDHYYDVATPGKIHEVLAQFVEIHLKD